MAKSQILVFNTFRILDVCVLDFFCKSYHGSTSYNTYNHDYSVGIGNIL